MGKRKTRFRKSTQDKDFKDTESVVNELIASLKLFKLFELLEAGGDYEQAALKLKSAGTTAYQAMEHAYKNVIFHHYDKLYEQHQITWSQYKENTTFEREGHYFTHTELKDAFLKFESNCPADLTLISRGSDRSNNNPKHNATTPDAKELKIQLAHMVKFFQAYLNSSADYPSLSDSYAGAIHAWQEFNELVGGFSSEYHYILIAPSALSTEHDYISIFCVNWDLVIDFNPESDTVGILHEFVQSKKIAPSIRTLNNAEKRKKFQSATYPHWIMANGFADQDETVITDYTRWKRAYGQNIKDILQKFHEVYTKCLKIVVLPGLDDSYLKFVVESCIEAFVSDDGESIYGVDILLIEGSEKCLDIDDLNVKHLDLSLEEFLHRLNEVPKRRATLGQKKSMPGMKNPDGLSNDLSAKLESFSEPVYLNIENMEPEGDVRDFYTARRDISWVELACGKDLQRSIYTNGIYGRLTAIMQEHPRVLYDIAYKPGYGGTTMLRRIAWDFHTHYPTLLLFRYSDDLINYLKQLYENTKLPMLILVDSNYLTRSDAELIRQDLRRESINHMILFMRRRNRIGEAPSRSELFDIPELSVENQEVSSMVDMLLPYVGSEVCRHNIIGFRDNTRCVEERSPFYLALSAFDEDFMGIPRYVHNYLSQLPTDLTEYLCFIALADHINKPLDAQFFASHLRNDKVEEFLNKNLAFKSLVSFFDLNGQRLCKIKYTAFATEILTEITSGYSETERNKINFLNLTDYVIRFIEYTRPNPRISNSNLTNFLREMLITRREDVDTEKPRFSKLITEIGGYDSVKHQWSQEGQAAVGRIFKKLTEVYPDDPHFNAHLARYLCYIEKDYDKAIAILDEAIDIRGERTEDDPLLLHMKGMVYAARITKKTIPEIVNMYNRGLERKAYQHLLQSIKDDYVQAERIFAKVRQLHSGLAGHMSDIRLCINIIDLQKRLEGVDSVGFWENHPDDWYMELADHANTLFDACKEYEDDSEGEEKERIEEITGAILTIREGIERSIQWYQDYLKSAPSEKRAFIRRHLARACIERNTRENSQEEWKYIATLMEDNMAEEPENEANIRTWFNAIIHIRADDPDDMLRQAVIRLNEWVALSDENIEAHFYRYLLTYIQAVEGISDAEGRLPGYLSKMRSLSGRLEYRTNIRYWLGNSGHGIERLIHRNDFPILESAKAKQMLFMLRGRVSSYISDVHAYITAYRSEVFFNPYSTDGRISRDSQNSLVVFGIGFSYDGPRAYNSSVELYTGQDTSTSSLDMPPLAQGTSVRCKVYHNTEKYVDVELIGYPGEKGSIAVECLADPYGPSYRPTPEGPLLDAVVLYKDRITTRTGYREVWRLTMKQVGSNLQEENAPLRNNEKLQTILRQMKNS